MVSLWLTYWEWNVDVFELAAYFLFSFFLFHQLPPGNLNGKIYSVVGWITDLYAEKVEHRPDKRSKCRISSKKTKFWFPRKYNFSFFTKHFTLHEVTQRGLFLLLFLLSRISWLSWAEFVTRLGVCSSTNSN